ncbi:hypothetical protein H6F47_13165 [Sphaerospermopsis sp. FACHB-1094]|uniref:hypothetical protein n=1 Tax=Sphaerospermopsis sp. FACHB-1094 TaxID=2692861 RepID=UPI0016851B78|nr:hypothetical protein [Sphaerospermopsis sp. FACHB-1094]MBD2133355.1 hypothetical protein [Sphaerospermopsis sp. FACHB-1094]
MVLGENWTLGFRGRRQKVGKTKIMLAENEKNKKIALLRAKHSGDKLSCCAFNLDKWNRHLAC